jgi:thiol-disulfide isomerase/thioredoxin
VEGGFEDEIGRLNMEVTMKTLVIMLLSLLCVTGLGTVRADSVLMFSAEWCKYCKIAKKDLLDNQDETAAWEVAMVDADTSRDVVKEYGVKTLPTFIYLNDAGEEVDRQVGYKGYRHLRRWVERNKR